MLPGHQLVRQSQAQTAANFSSLRRVRLRIGDSQIIAIASPSANAPNPRPVRTPVVSGSKSLATLQEVVRPPHPPPEIWFNARYSLASTGPPVDSPEPKHDERKAKLGKTLRILQERLPTLLQSPLPQEILAPNISLHLFPTTHPHLPVVSGRVAYIAALWTSPIAWNRVPIVGNVKLEILSQRMVAQPLVSSTSGQRRQGAYGDKLVVRWRTAVGSSKGWSLPFGLDGIGAGNGKDFTGMFIFEFDKEGKILSHTIETVQEGGDWERGVGAKVVGLTDRLLGEIKGRGSGSQEGGSCPAFHGPETRKGR